MNMTVEQFNSLLDVFTKDTYDHRAMLERIARHNPQAVLDVLGENELHYPELEHFCKEGKKIQAIKHVRTVSKMGLKEAKDFVEEYIATRSF